MPGPQMCRILSSTACPKSLQRLSYGDFLAVVASGKKDVSNSSNLVMPALGENKNVMCYLDAIYIYLRARSNGVIETNSLETIRIHLRHLART